MTAAMVPAQMPHMSIVKQVTLPSSTPWAPLFLGDLNRVDRGTGPVHGWSYVGTPVGLGQQIDWYSISSSTAGDGVARFGPGVTSLGVPGVWSLRITVSLITGTFTDEIVNFEMRWNNATADPFSLMATNLTVGEAPISNYQVVHLLAADANKPLAFQVGDYFFPHSIDRDILFTLRADLQQLIPDIALSPAAAAQPDPQTLSSHPRNSSLLYGS